MKNRDNTTIQSSMNPICISLTKEKLLFLLLSDHRRAILIDVPICHGHDEVNNFLRRLESLQALAEQEKESLLIQCQLDDAREVCKFRRQPDAVQIGIDLRLRGVDREDSFLSQT